MFTASRKDLAELLALFRIVEDMAVAEGTVEGTPGEMIPVEAVMREEDKVRALRSLSASIFDSKK